MQKYGKLPKNYHEYSGQSGGRKIKKLKKKMSTLGGESDLTCTFPLSFFQPPHFPCLSFSYALISIHVSI